MNELSKREMRTVFCETLMNMAENDQKVIVLDADLMLAMGTIPFREKYPERTFDCGVQEANMIGVAAGLSATGFIPFAHTFAPFASRRACDQIFMSCAYAKQNVKIVGSDPGITAALNGGTHMPFEDLGIMSTIPEITVWNHVMRFLLRESYSWQRKLTEHGISGSEGDRLQSYMVPGLNLRLENLAC